MAKSKYKKISKKEMENVLFPIRILSESLQNTTEIIRQFNLLTSCQRTNISSEFSRCEAKLKIDVEPGNEDMYLTCIVVNLNIIASKYGIDPATVCMCINLPCKCNEKLLVK